MSLHHNSPHCHMSSQYQTGMLSMQSAFDVLGELSNMLGIQAQHHHHWWGQE